MQIPRILVRAASRQAGRRSYHHGDHQVATLNDLPSPQGSWQTRHDARQRKYNAHLLLGIGALCGTIVFGKAAGLLNFYNDIPEHPADIPSYK